MSKEIIIRTGEIVEKNTGEGSFCALGLIDLDGFQPSQQYQLQRQMALIGLLFARE